MKQTCLIARVLALSCCLCGCTVVRIGMVPLANPKIQVTEFKVDDTPENRRLVKQCLDSVVAGYELTLSTNTEEGFSHYGDDKPWASLHARIAKADFHFGAGQITNLEAFALRLKNPGDRDAVARYIAGRLSQRTTEILSTYTGGSDTNLPWNLAVDLNRIIDGGGSIYDPARFQTVEMSQETRNMLSQSVTGLDLFKMNRLLLDDVFRGEIRPMGHDKIVIEYKVLARQETERQRQIDLAFQLWMKKLFGDSLHAEVYAYRQT